MRNIFQNVKFSSDYCQFSLQTLETALSQVPVYQPWQALDPGPAYPVDIRYAALPALSKKDIREHFPQGMLPPSCNLNQALAAGEIGLVETSGTTDDKVTNIWNQKWWDASEKASWELNSQIAGIATGDHREAILVNPRNVGFASDKMDLPLEKRRLSRFLYLNDKTDPLTWTDRLMDRMIDELNIFQPAVLEANPSYLARLSRYIDSNQKSVFQPKVIVFTYEYPTQFHYRQISRVFPSPIISSYGTTETGYVFMQCEKGKLHQNSQSCRVDFQPLKPEHGGPLLGRILVTPFHNPWSYFLRFDTGDLAYLEPTGQCECGRNSGLILSSIAGRQVNLTLTCSGRLVTLFELDNAISILEGVSEYKLVQPAQGVYELSLVTRRSDRSQLTETATEILKKLYGYEAETSIIYENSLSPENSGKYLISRTLFPVDLENYLDKRYIFHHKSQRRGIR